MSLESMLEMLLEVLDCSSSRPARGQSGSRASELHTTLDRSVIMLLMLKLCTLVSTFPLTALLPSSSLL